MAQLEGSLTLFGNNYFVNGDPQKSEMMDLKFSNKLMAEPAVEVGSSDSQSSVYPSLQGLHTQQLASIIGMS